MGIDLNETVLIVDDDEDIRNVLKLQLESEGYKVKLASNGEEALSIVDKDEPNLVLLDIMMPKVDGLEVCKIIRQKSLVPIIFLSAKASEFDKVMGLSLGADDYVIKPFSPIELSARIHAQLRRASYFSKNEDTKGCINLRGLIIDENNRQVKMYGQAIKLTKTEFDILLLLAKNLNRVFSLEEIFERVWKEKYFDGNNTVMVHIARLRDKLGDKNNQWIQNVWGVGYKIEG